MLFNHVFEPLMMAFMNKKHLIPLAFFVILGFLWQMVSNLSPTLVFVLPPPSAIFGRLWESYDRFWFHALATFWEMAGGFVLALTAAFPLAWSMDIWRSARQIFQPLFIIVQCIPMFTLAPLMVIWFGWSYTAIVIPTALMIFFPLTMNIYQGLRATPQPLLDYFYLNRATRWQIFTKLKIPYAMPHIFSGFRIAAAIAGIAAIAGEWAGAQKGLGVLMLESRRAMDLETTFGALFCVVGLSLMFYGMLYLVEKKMMIGRRLRLASHVASIMMACLILSGCRETEPKIQETRLVLDWLPNPNHVPLYAGIDKGIFAKYGINLKILKICDPSDAVPFLTSGQAELAISYMPRAQQMMSKRGDLVVAGLLITRPLNVIVYRSNETINNPSDLNGKIIGHCTDGIHLLLLNKILQKNEMVPKELKYVSFDVIPALANNHLDALYGVFWNIECPQWQALGVETSYFTMEELGIPTYYELIILAQKNVPDHFQSALQESIDFSKAHPDEAFESYLKLNPDKSSKTRVWEKNAWNNTVPLLAEKQEIDPLVWDTFLNWQIANGLITH